MPSPRTALRRVLATAAISTISAPISPISAPISAAICAISAPISADLVHGARPEAAVRAAVPCCLPHRRAW